MGSQKKVPKEKRKDLMKSFQKVLYSDTINKAEEAYKIAKHSEFDNWNKYFNSYWDFRFKWCLAWRDEMVRGHQTNNYSEITVRIFKDVVLSRVNAYNVIALIYFVCTVLNDYYCRRFREFVNSRTSKARLFLRAQSKKVNDIKPENISQLSETEYIIIMSSDVSYEINTKIGIYVPVTKINMVCFAFINVQFICILMQFQYIFLRCRRQINIQFLF